ncbi:potassium channel subfamily K member 4 [Colossoma macropomum]|uniref:potassium channel subfamily K member 4 n=1 Tax=Colossoma macropomum TaxID=42526 RepID=UPI001863D208|nr:potassium channel subfamily K member 4 [Colossoma macropomum]
MRCSTLLAILTAVLLYLVMGALVFNTLEAPIEEDKYNTLLQSLQDSSNEFLYSYTCVSPDNLRTFLGNITEAIQGGVDPTNNNSTFSSSWDLASAFFFSGTIITTIGYGNISPQTEWGRLFCICYALMGIPLFGFLLAGVGDHLGTGLRKAVAKIEMLFLKWKVSPTIVRVISAVLSILLGLVLFVFVPILVFQEVEKWTLLESAYFVVITLTTVGFGDYVAGDSGAEGTDHWYKPLVWFWILLGLAYFASVLTMIGNWLRVLSKKTRAEMEELRAHATDWTQNIQNMSVDFRIPGKLDESFKRRRRKRRRGPRSHGASHSTSGMAPGEGGKRENGQPDRESGSRSSVSYSTSSNESDSEESETGSESTQTEQVPKKGEGEDGPLPKIPTEATHSQPLDYFGENLAYIDESSDAVSTKLHLDPLLDMPEPKSAAQHKAKRRRPRRPAAKKTPKTSPTKLEHKEPNGDILPPNHTPPPPPKP